MNYDAFHRGTRYAALLRIAPLSPKPLSAMWLMVTLFPMWRSAFQIMNKSLLFVTTLRPASARTVDETCDQLGGGAKRWRRLAGGGVPQTVVAV